MKIFISSVITGFGPFRNATARGAATLRHQVIRAEQFGAVPDSPQRVCLGGVRDADVVLLLLGQRYGEVQPGSGVSATHEEFREARNRCQILVFVQNGVTPEPAQQTFLKEVQDWAGGHLTASFSTPDELLDAVVSALHDLEIARKAGDVNETELLERARALLPRERRSSSASLCVIVVGAPRQQVVRPAEIETTALSNAIMQEALFGTSPVLTTTSGSKPLVRDGQLLIEQEDSSVMVDQLGDIRTLQPARDEYDRRESSLPVLIEEEIAERLERSLRFASWVLDKIDPAGRLTHVTPVAALIGAGYLGWRTRAEDARKSHPVQVGSGSDEALHAVMSPAVHARAALRVNASALAEDLMVLLRRQVRP